MILGLDFFFAGTERVLAAPTAKARMSEESPLLMIVAWLVITWSVVGQVRKTCRLKILPGLQAGGLQILLAVVLTALAPTFGRQWQLDFGVVGVLLNHVSQGLAIVLSCIAFPRRVVSFYMPLEDLYQHYMHRAEEWGRKSSFVSVAMSDDSHSDDENTDENVANLVRTRSRRLIWCSRLAFLTLVILKPLVLLITTSQHWWVLHTICSTLLLFAGSGMAWYAASELTTEAMHRVLPQYRQLAFLVVAIMWALQLQDVLTCLMGMTEGLRGEDVKLLCVIHMGEIAFVTSMAAHLLDCSRDPLIQFALVRQSRRETLEATPVKSGLLSQREIRSVFSQNQASDDTSTSPAQRGGRHCVELLVAFLDVHLVVRLLFFVGLPWPGNPEQERKKSDDSESEGSEWSDTLTSAEATIGRDAWKVWSQRTGVHPAWHGRRMVPLPPVLEHSTTHPELRLTTSEKKELEDGSAELAKNNSWWKVPGDLFTDRVRSKFLAVIMVVIIVVKVYSGGWMQGKLARFDNPMEVLGLQFLIVFVLWVMFGLLVFGNNAFVAARCHRRWAVAFLAVCVWLLLQHCLHFFFNSRSDHEGSFELGSIWIDVERRWADFSVGILAAIGFWLAMELLLNGEKTNDYHKTVFNALWYTSDLFLPTGDVVDLRRRHPTPGEVLLHRARNGEFEAQATVEKDHGDGTCDVKMADGRKLVAARYKSFRRPATSAAEDDAHDMQLARFKALRTSAADFPAVLYLGAISSVPLLLSVACALLLVVRAVLHVVFHIHVYASLFIFAMHSSVVAPAPAPGAALSPSSPAPERLLSRDPLVHLSASVLDWRLNGGQGVVDAPTLQRIANTSGLYYSSEGGEPTPCAQMSLAENLVVLLGRGGESNNLQLEHLRGTVRWLLKGLDEFYADKVLGGLDAMWNRISGGNEDYRLDPAAVGLLMCEAKLLASVNVKAAGAVAFWEARSAVVSVALNISHAVKHRVRGFELDFPVLKRVVEHLRGLLLSSIDTLENGLQSWADGNGWSFRDVARTVKAGLNHSAYFQAAGSLMKGHVPGPGVIIALLDRDGDGKLNMADEAPALIDLGRRLCRKAGCAQFVEGKLWQALAFADIDEDGQLDESDVTEIGIVLKDAVVAGKRLLKGLCPAAFGGALAGNAAAALAFQELLKVADSNNDLALSVDEVLAPLNSLLGASVSNCAADALSQAPGIGGILKAFKRADMNKDGKLTLDEFAIGGFSDALATYCPGSVERRLFEEPDFLPELVRGAHEMVEELTEDESPEWREESSSWLSSPLAVLDSLLHVLADGSIPLVLVASNWVLYLSLLIASVCQLYVVQRCFSRYRKLFAEMQSGRHSYVGHTAKEKLESGFAETTMFPGMLFGTTLLGFLSCATLAFFLIVIVVLLATPVALPLWQAVGDLLLYLTLAFAIKMFISYVVMNQLLTEEGEVVYPILFSLFWFFQLFLNFILGVSGTFLRAILVTVWALLSCCFVDFTLMDEAFVDQDSAYYSLLTMVYTSHVRANPIKKALVTALLRHVQSVQAKSEEEDSDDEAVRVRQGRSRSFLRARARFMLAITLHRNPELQPYRKYAMTQAGAESSSSATCGLCS